jgi:hypothetical protein
MSAMLLDRAMTITVCRLFHLAHVPQEASQRADADAADEKERDVLHTAVKLRSPSTRVKSRTQHQY